MNWIFVKEKNRDGVRRKITRGKKVNITDIFDQLDHNKKEPNFITTRMTTSIKSKHYNQSEEQPKYS